MRLRARRVQASSMSMRTAFAGFPRQPDPLRSFSRAIRTSPIASRTRKWPRSRAGRSTSANSASRMPNPPAQSVPWGVTRVGGGAGTGSGSGTAWVIDTGIDLDHPDLNVDTGPQPQFRPADPRRMTAMATAPMSPGPSAPGTMAFGVIGVGPGATARRGARARSTPAADQLRRHRGRQLCRGERPQWRCREHEPWRRRVAGARSGGGCRGRNWREVHARGRQ